MGHFNNLYFQSHWSSIQIQICCSSLNYSTYFPHELLLLSSTLMLCESKYMYMFLFLRFLALCEKHCLCRSAKIWFLIIHVTILGFTLLQRYHYQSHKHHNNEFGNLVVGIETLSEDHWSAMQHYHGHRTTYASMVPAPIVMQTTLKITLCNNLQEINLSIFRNWAWSQWISAIAVVFRCHYWHQRCSKPWLDFWLML